ncbi:MAG: hypothetical protein ACLFTS_01400 [Candidatus Paceibacterota bacterium]
MQDFSSKEKIKKIKTFTEFFVIFALVSFLSFGLGRLSVIEDSKTPVKVEYDFEAMSAVNEEKDISFIEEINKEEGSVVGSKNGEVYHLPWCSGAHRINTENEVWFVSEAEAREAGYRPASNCKGLNQ